MHSHIEIRLADLGDAHALLDMRRAAIRQLSITHLSALVAETWAMQSGIFRVASAITNDEVWVANCDLKTVGWIHRASNSIEGLYVSPAAAHQGVGATLVRFVEHRIEQDGHDRVNLKSSLNAMGFYLRLGYISDDTQTATEAIAMYKKLPLRLSANITGSCT
jgi:GNAT superfamily N-acetyltransferase